MSAIQTKEYPQRLPLTVSFLGLGAMGLPMAGHLAAAGYQVTVYNRNPAKAEQWAAEFKGNIAATPAEAAKDADIIFCCVGNDDALREMTTGPNGAYQTMKAGAIFVDHTTTSAEVAKEVYQVAREKGLHFIDAPVSGGQAGAINGVLTVMCGGDEEVFNKAKPVMDVFSRSVIYLGKSGSGQLAKMVNQICIAGLVQGLSEALAFGERTGLDMEKVLAVISKGAAQSWQMENRGKTMLENKFDFGFAVDWMRKDLGLVFDEAARNGADLPVTRLVDSFYAEVQANGGNRWDTSSLITRLKKG
ncbi:MAG: NAD(P)-dependent oxidoreductase [Pelistega sp.]|nr:NAD(P)-dependent oxidoreductase [Pelistega sp.]